MTGSPDNRVKVLVGMSGGVDSSVAAALLKEKGYDVVGAIMQIWSGDDSVEESKHHACYGPGEVQDIGDARSVARMLGIPFHVIDLRDEYRAEVLDYYCREYLAGRTPNPCLKCNRTVKFGSLPRKARENGVEFDYFATGHYARVEYSQEKGRYVLKKALDLAKDQSYFLSGLTQEQLRHALFPLGDLTKGEVRQIAARLGLPVSDKVESQDFVAGGYRSLVGAAPPGPILDAQGNTLGEHRGITYYTIGQRKGLGISLEEPKYVIDIDSEKNAIIVGDAEDLYGRVLVASGTNWIGAEKPLSPIQVMARIRYRHRESAATVTPLEGDSVRVLFERSQPAITPGQTVVFYEGDEVLGGGTIERTKE